MAKSGPAVTVGVLSEASSVILALANAAAAAFPWSSLYSRLPEVQKCRYRPGLVDTSDIFDTQRYQLRLPLVN